LNNSGSNSIPSVPPIMRKHACTILFNIPSPPLIHYKHIPKIETLIL
jgi:hypothetical protein